MKSDGISQSDVDFELIDVRRMRKRGERKTEIR